MGGKRGIKKYVEWFMKSNAYKKYLLPGFISQSVIIAGGYGTGRELVEYFAQYGPTGGLMGMFFVTIVLWALVYAASFEFARVFRSYDYRTFFSRLLGPGWVLYEICYMLLLLIVLGVVGAAAGSILKDSFGISPIVGSAILLILIAILAYWGSEAIAVTLSWWSFILYAVYIVFLIAGFSKFGSAISQNLGSGIVKPGWPLGGFKYAFYNLGCFPAVLFALRYIETRKDAIISGILASFITMIPGFFFYLVVIGFYPEIVGVEVPAYYTLQKIGVPALLATYMIVLFGTLIETGTGFIHAVNERINSYLVDTKGYEMPRIWRGALAFTLALVGLLISTFGLIALIAKGYGTISWGFFILHGVALFTIGIYKLHKKLSQH